MSWPRSLRGTWRYTSVLVALLIAVGAPLANAHAQADPVISGYGRHIQFAGYDWCAKVSNVPVGPGPNFFSDSTDSVWVDDLDQLHLRVSQAPTGNWDAAEMVMQPSLGYGTYRFYLQPAPAPLDPNVVLGLFTWNDDPTQNHRELDVELAQWGDVNMPNGRYSVQPFELPDHMFSFNAGPIDAAMTHELRWAAGQAAFASWQGSDSHPADDTLIASRVFVDGVPEPGGQQVRLNLWLDKGLPPTTGQPVEVVVSNFEFIPELAPGAGNVNPPDAAAD